MQNVMRSEAEMMRMIVETAKADERIRAVYMNGSRTNLNAVRDCFQDYDIVYVVTDAKPFYSDPDWIRRFGTILLMQMPEYMDYLLGKEYHPEQTFGWLMIFDDGNRIDLHVSALEYAKKDIRSDRLCRVLLDKDHQFDSIPPESDADHYVKKPSEDEYFCTCNEFWWCLNNVAKGMARKELTYAMDMLYDIVRPCLSKMLGWKVGAEHNWSVSVGKSCKYMDRYLSDETWQRYLDTVPQCRLESMQYAVNIMMELFEETAKTVAGYLGVSYCQKEADASKEYLRWALARG